MCALKSSPCARKAGNPKMRRDGRVILVLRPDSSKKTKRRTSTTFWNFRHSSRLFAMSSRSCSLAFRVFFENIAYFAGNFVESRQRAFFPKAFSEFTERGVWIVFNISCQLRQFLKTENRASVATWQRREPVLTTCANPSANRFEVVAKNIRKLSPGGGFGQIRLYNKRTHFRACYLHTESLANLYNLSMLKCSSTLICSWRHRPGCR